MRAVVHDRYGPPDVLRLAEVPRPVPEAGEVLVAVMATTLSRTDCALRSGKPFVGRFVTGLRRPKRPVLGVEFAGEVVAAGPGAGEYQAGDRVFGVNPWRFGAHAEFVRVPESAPMARMPDGLGYAEAAAICDGATQALIALKPVNPRKGQSILVYGASGSVGTAAVQLARHFGAEVTAVCATAAVDLVGSLGADVVIDRTREDFTANGRRYDVIFDAVGKHSFRRCRASLNPGGAYLATDGLRNVLLARWTARFGDRKVIFPVPPRYDRQDVLLLKRLIEAGEYRAVIDRRYRLDEVAEATRYVETEQKIGNVVLTVGDISA
ncbi:NAD(P)-dependent alcohol dehydrogenase [Nonomuraea jiangxiensis]|uniref:NADPH:quinone reductase n=1 Tax=Nonomuraea jiangxiensis TaxID=633440 RepID=A0A1G8I6Q0_9ACTN|nr:NAD(P)-dependent alcohol dehydrogenase [Nonomuraea jiangxiensis]SDI14502.1 NADPH:quinone reductase [Nonomuraea jiangxiensis]